MRSSIKRLEGRRSPRLTRATATAGVAPCPSFATKLRQRVTNLAREIAELEGDA